MTNTNKPSMDISFEGVNLILKLKVDEQHVEAQLKAFSALKFGTTSYKKFVEQGVGPRKELAKFHSAWAAAQVPPEEKRLQDLEKTVALLGMQVQDLTERVNRADLKPKKVVRKDINKHHRMQLWWKRISANEPKAKKIEGILDVAGIRILTVDEMAKPYGGFGKNETRSIQAVEELYDKRGAEGLAQVANILVQLEPDSIRLPYIEAVDYALYEAPRPLKPDAIFLNAVDYFHVPWAKLEAQLGELRTRVPVRTRGELLGKLIAGEERF